MNRSLGEKFDSFLDYTLELRKVCWSGLMTGTSRLREESYKTKFHSHTPSSIPSLPPILKDHPHLHLLPVKAGWQFPQVRRQIARRFGQRIDRG